VNKSFFYLTSKSVLALPRQDPISDIHEKMVNITAIDKSVLLPYFEEANLLEMTKDAFSQHEERFYCKPPSGPCTATLKL
jgi:hypothetical protein